jgi:serine/threonine protein kinase/Tfp pilus assembly protein PilF
MLRRIPVVSNFKHNYLEEGSNQYHYAAGEIVHIKCPACKSENPDDSKFCRECGASLKASQDASGTRTFQTPLKGISKETVIAGKYEIIEKLGEGGMGVVYKAKDTRLDRSVALKFLPSDLTKDLEAKKRFIQEAKAAAALNDPHICTIYEIDESEEQTFISMEHIDGQSLKDKLGSGPLDFNKAKDIALQVAEGLKEAHEKGIIHRDIKPANIMLTEKGQAKITDFGLAKLSWGVDLTKTSTVMGTAAYMSPEQARGEAVDHRTDIWSLGAMFYEMLAGKRPFMKDQEQAIIFAILNEAPASLSILRSDVPVYMEDIIERALNKEADGRYQKVDELIRDFEKPHVVSPQKAEKSIVVLPFDDLSPDKDNEYFSDGLTEEIISDLSKIHSLRVISRTSAMMLKGTKKSMKTIAKELGIRYALEGSVRKAGNNLRITAQLIDSLDDVHLWAEKYNGTLDDVFDIQEKVSTLIADALKIKLSADETSLLHERPIENVYAYDCYLQARRYTMAFTREGLDKALQLLKKAIGFTGENAALYAGTAFTHFQYANMGIDQTHHIQKADMFIEKALQLDPESTDAHFVIGCMQMVFHGDVLNGLRHFKHAYQHRSGDTELMQMMSWLYALIGKTEEAITLADQCIDIDPLNSGSRALKAVIRFMQGRFDEAQEPVLQFQHINPDSNMWNLWAALILAYRGCHAEARELIDTHVDKKDQDGLGKLCLALNYALRGDDTSLSGLMDADFVTTVQMDCQYSWHMAAFYSFLGEKNQALKWLENAVKRGFINYPFLQYYDRLLDNIRKEPRFQLLIKRVKKEWANFEV